MNGRPDPSKKTELTCENEACGKTFLVYRSKLDQVHAAGQEIRFCSRACHDTTRPGPVCTKCGNPNRRGGRTRLCEDCAAVSPAVQAAVRARERIADCPPGMRWCRRCDRFKLPELFTAMDEHLCTACAADRDRDAHLRRVGLSQEIYDKALAAQGGRCAICGNRPRKAKFHADHDHKTGVFRGLLCSWCNHRLLGGARESVEVLQRAIDYLTRPPGPAAVGLVLMPHKPNRRPRGYDVKRRAK